MFEQPLFVALECPDPIALLSLLIDRNADMMTNSTSLGTNVVMQACFLGVEPEIVDFLLQRWPVDYDWYQNDRQRDSTFSLACQSMKPNLVVYLLSRIPKLSQIERENLWRMLSKMVDWGREGVEDLVSQICKSAAAKELFELECDTGIRSLIVHADRLGSKKIVFFRSIGKFIRLAMIKELWRSVEAMEAIRPDIVRPIVFVYLMPWMGKVPDTIQAMGNQLQRDCLWSLVRPLFLARVQPNPCASDTISLTDLPDVCFQRVADFYLYKSKDNYQ